MMLELKQLSVDDGIDVYQMLQEIPAEENGLLNKANGLTYDEYKEWLIAKQRDAEQEGIVDGWKVPSTTFWLFADGIPVGFGNVRHFLTEALSKAGGHIGYGIAPRFRGKGYGNEILRLLLNEAHAIGIEEALVTIRLDNTASQAVALANGGVITERTDERLLIWINTRKMIETERLILRRWTEADAESLYEYAKDSDIGPAAGWPPHKSVDESLEIIRNVFTGEQCYAICEKENGKAIGAIELKLKGHTDMTDRDDECELGYWLGKPFWGRGYMPEAVRELLRFGFEELGMTTIWCGYYDGNLKSKRVQEKVGFVYHHTCNEVEVPLMNEIRIGHTNYMTKEHWESLYKS